MALTMPTLTMHDVDCDWNDATHECSDPAKYVIQCTGKYCATHNCQDSLRVCETHLRVLLDYDVNEFPHFLPGDTYIPDVMKVVAVLDAKVLA